jgi:branched-chain amino acid transport system permease protein
MGIDTDRIYALTWAVGIVCVGVAGVLLAPIYHVYPTARLQFVLIAYVAVVLGGLGDMVGAARRPAQRG